MSYLFKALVFIILGLQIFFQNIKVGGGKKIKIKITKKLFLAHLSQRLIGELIGYSWSGVRPS